MGLGWAVTMFLELFLSCLLIFIAWKRMNKGGKLPPGPTPIPFLGNLLQVRTDATFRSLMKLSEKYGPVFTVYMGPRPVVVLCGHKAVKEALVDQADDFSGRGQLASVEQNFKGHGAPIDPTFFLSRSVSNIISSIVFGSRFDYEDKQFLKLLQLVNECFSEMSTPWTQLYGMYSGVMQYLPGRHHHTYYLVEELKDFIASRVKINEAAFDYQNPRDFIDCFLIKMRQDKNNPHTEFNLKNLVLTTLNLFFAGTETVSSTLRYGFLLLMKHPEVEAKIHEEINQVIGPHRLPRVEDRVKMPYTDAVIHEIQRLLDIVPMGVPHTVTRDTQFRGYLLPKGTNVFALLGSVLKDPKYFRYPDAFYPQHFLDEKGRFKKNEAFVPFSSAAPKKSTKTSHLLSAASVLCIVCDSDVGHSKRLEMPFLASLLLEVVSASSPPVTSPA
ncbi:cytochrome P450 2G1 isoform X2 [Cebus imitator]|uniref:cytochrome P450 2G1 isoform X2 n=1 Tax=Cebus imitator TaxID=2715852 RepID=UPI00080A23A4|nr:cytochrome P450 2G1 isoform X2 [Cebus imitator]